MGYYLIDHPPASNQYRNPRREPLSGVVVVHTAEGGPAANVASFIARRSDPGSYHVLCDPDAAIPMIPDGWEAFHVAADSLNRSTWGVSAACRAADWNPDDPFTLAMIHTMAAEVRAFAHRNQWDPASARWITRDEALAARGRRLDYIGLIGHGTCQPADRSDAWTRHPERARLDALLLDAVTATTPAPPPATEEAPPMVFITSPATEVWYLYDGYKKRPVGPGENQLLVDLGLVPRDPATGGPGVKMIDDAALVAIPDA